MWAWFSSWKRGGATPPPEANLNTTGDESARGEYASSTAADSDLTHDNKRMTSAAILRWRHL